MHPVLSLQLYDSHAYLDRLGVGQDNVGQVLGIVAAAIKVLAQDGMYGRHGYAED